ncbi:helix-turn-helix transcriptional regulator [Actinokineospora pegani]|uniref:helix-turn-helix transcriptional regulator n=1 Tax=Actinokineospora pegani TaxID=2654637 RepID=UPI0018D4590D|nr:helix-turn-helix domain-containing protein [Actinokineospora pegani]
MRLEGRRGSPELDLRDEAGRLATTRLVELAEPLTRATVAALRASWWTRTPVVDTDDLLAVARAAVVHGVWAYDPTRPSGPGYLRLWIAEHVKRQLGGVSAPVSVPARTRVRFARIAAARAVLLSELGREPTDEQVRARVPLLSQQDLDDERWTRGSRRPAVPLTPEIEDPGSERLTADVHRGPEGWLVLLREAAVQPAEAHVLALAARGMTEREIASATGVSRTTVRRRLHSVRTRLTDPGGPAVRALVGMPAEDLEGLGLVPIAKAVRNRVERAA